MPSFTPRSILPVLFLAALAGCADNVVTPAPTPKDSVAPTVVMTTGTSRGTSSPTATIAGTLTDDVEVTRATVQVNGGAEQTIGIVPAREVAFSTPVTLTLGAVNRAIINAYDAAGNRGSSDTLVLRSDTVTRVMVVSSPREGEVYLSPESPITPVYFSVSVAGGFGTASVSLNGGAPGRYVTTSSCNYACFSSTLFGLREGENVLEITVNNSALKEPTRTVRFFFYTVPKVVLTNLGASQAAVTTGETVRLPGTASYSAGVARLSYQLNGGAEQPLPGSGTSVPFDFTVPLQNGVNKVNIHAYTAVGVRSTTSIDAIRSPAPGTPGAFSAIATGYAGHSCGLVSGALYCWGPGKNSERLTTPQPFPGASGLSFTRVTTAAIRSCALTAAGTAYCWGDAPTPLAGGLRFTTIDAGRFHVCAVDTDAAAYCWGTGAGGRLGNGSTADASAPALVAGGHRWSTISAGEHFGCGLTVNGAALCWGEGSYGELGSGNATNTTAPVAVAGGLTFAAIDVGDFSTCALDRAGAAWCWGLMMRETLENITTPTRVAGGLTFRSISVGTAHACGVTTGGAGYCWGSSSAGQLGNGVAAYSTTRTPVPVSGSLVFTSIVAGDDYTCGVTTNGAAYCWGLGTDGQLGAGTKANSAVPVRVVDPT